MKLIKTIERIIKEAEEKYYSAEETKISREELYRLEKNYQDSLKLLNIYKNVVNQK